ncbi:cobalt ECF transporter T component CbiQ [Polymorphum gilvum]|uniref:ABC-type cobalt transport system permease component CbiQ and related transporter-like protein n=1 Tax=Polymorphum gilvum (strain LMG 25793 / CGMCC 1.9160 / SL003B-26A1) TaxID=991905 RepID=F2J364_POLGS|nr:cobalt ECF transporter T component CbiQ [Polymorphum gilvum]ADZ69871.1 ABC-type cobalt transport system permease component CbiQ and related transporter-like protein [Polymorphum gilvum SL003B-26A1]
MTILPQDLRLRLVATFVAVAALSQLRDLATAALALAGVCLLALACGIERRLWRRLLHVEGFVLLLFLILPFTIAGRPVLVLGPVSASAEGIARAGLIACKVSVSVLLLTTLLGSVEPARLGAALQALRVPEPVVRLFVLTVRYLSLIRAEALRLHDAMRARAFRPGSNRHTWRSYGYLIGMLLVRALDRAQRVDEAMLCRGYAGRFPHAALPAPSARDWTASAGLAGLAVATLLFDRL